MTTCWTDYESVTWDELIGPDGTPRPHARAVADFLDQLGSEGREERRRAAGVAIRQMGITFTVYSEEGNIDREWPFDIVPRVIAGAEWRRVERGLTQRLEALNLFIDDLYNEQRVIRDGVVPRELLDSSKNFRHECVGVRPPHGVWAHICGSDLVRDGDGTLFVLEDNLRVPSGVSYMIENREVMKRTFPEVFGACRVRPVDDYPGELQRMLRSLSRRSEPVLAVLTPGVFNSAYFEHAYLAQQIGAELVEGRDLVVGEDEYVYVRNVDGLERIDVIYRRVDDAWMDPEVFEPGSTLGVPGLMRSWKAGKVAIANAPGAGVADDKVVYSYVPDIIRYYLNEEPEIGNVPTFRCDDPDQRAHVLDNLQDLVVKPANESGGYGMLIGPHSTAEERAAMAKRIVADPRNWIAQPTLAISTAPTLTDKGIAARHVDLRPFILQGEQITVTTGGLTRVALVEGSLIVNSSQGGGSKDTWIVERDNSSAPADSLDDGDTDADAPVQHHGPVRRTPRRSARDGELTQSMSGGGMQQTLPGGMSQSISGSVKSEDGALAAANDAEADRVGHRPLVLARSAENMYWLARYIERAENTVRLIATHGALLMDLPAASSSGGWRSLVTISGDDEIFNKLHDIADEKSVTHFLLAEPSYSGSLLNIAGSIHYNLRAVRDALPNSLYEAINELCLTVRAGVGGSLGSAQRTNFLKKVELALLAICGTAEGSMSRDTAWLVMRIGCHLERADMTSRILDVHSGILSTVAEGDPSAGGFAFAEREWISVLRSLLAFRMYRLHVNRPVRGADVLAYLLNDPDLPRAYRYCLDRIAAALGKLGDTDAADAALAKLRTRIDAADVAALARDTDALHDYIDELQVGLSDVGQAIGARFFPPPPPDAGPDASSDASSDITADTAADTTPDSSPDSSPDPSPEASS